MKRNTLYTANSFNQRLFYSEGGKRHTGKPVTINKWNQPAFMPKQESKNLFSDGSQMDNTGDLKEQYYGSGSSSTGNSSSGGSSSGNIFGGFGASFGDAFKGAAGGFGGISGLGSSLGSAVGGGISSIGSAVGGAVGNLIGSGYESGVGNALGSLGKVASVIPGPWGAAISGGLQVLGGGVNALFGSKVDEKALKEANENTAKLNSFKSNATSLDDIKGPESVKGIGQVYKGGLFVSGAAEEKNRQLRNRLADAISFADRSVGNNIFNLTDDQMNDALANYSAYGGPIDTVDNNMSAIDYNFMDRYMTAKEKQIESKNKIFNIPSMPAFMQNGFAFGGDMQSNFADFPTGLTHIDAGNSHEMNPYDGVQLGTDSEGTPNLVEEGETVYNDYVFSKRIYADGGTLQKFHLPRKAKLTFADISKKLEKEIAERPADPISQAGFEAQMQVLQEQQERQKQEMEAARAGEAFKTLSPEEQTAVMQSAAQQEAMAEQAAQRQVEAEQQPSPEEIAMMQQQMSPEEQAAMEQQQLAQMQANVSALGGELVRAGDVKGNKNIYAYAGKMGKRQNRKLTQRYTADWFKQQAKALGIDDELMNRFKYTDDAEGNLAAFNQLYREAQYNKALETYRTGQRQDRRNKLFGDNGLYRYSNDRSKIYRGRVNETDRAGYINRDYTGEEEDGVLKGFLSTEDYNLKKAAYEAEKDANKKAALLKELEGYKAINERAGDYMHDFLGHRIESLENRSEDEILNNPNIDYSKGFKWDDNNAQTLQYPVGMDHSNMSYLRYVPALGGAVGLMNDIFSSPDYSRAEEIKKAGQALMTPREVTPHYIGNYLTYKPMDIWYQQNALNAQSRATDRALLNSASPSRAAGLLANSYNSQLASGNLYRQALEYNDAQKQKVEEFNRGTNIFNAQADMNAQQANQNAYLQAGRQGLTGIIAGNQMMDDIDARRSASLSANLTNLLQSIGNIGEEAYDEDRLKWLEGTGVLRSDYFNRGKYGASAAKGGKIKKKRGLTI